MQLISSYLTVYSTNSCCETTTSRTIRRLLFLARIESLAFRKSQPHVPVWLGTGPASYRPLAEPPVTTGGIWSVYGGKFISWREQNCNLEPLKCIQSLCFYNVRVWEKAYAVKGKGGKVRVLRTLPARSDGQWRTVAPQRPRPETTPTSPAQFNKLIKYLSELLRSITAKGVGLF